MAMALAINQATKWSTITSSPGGWPSWWWPWTHARTKCRSAIITTPSVTILSAAIVSPTICFRWRNSTCTFRPPELRDVFPRVWCCSSGSRCCSSGSKCRVQWTGRRLGRLQSTFNSSAQQFFSSLFLFFFEFPLSLPLLFSNLL